MTSFCKNLDILIKNNPPFKAMIKRYQPATLLETELARNGEWTARWDGSYICSRHNPSREAERFMERILEGGVECGIFGGFELGYAITAFRKQVPDGIIICVEPDPSVFIKSLEIQDYEKILDDPLFWLILTDDPNSLKICLKQADRKKIQLFIPQSFRDRQPDFSHSLENRVRQFLVRREINMNTLNRFGKRWVRNWAHNISLYKESIPLDLVKNSFAGERVLILAAGPSLGEILPQLKEISKYIFIIAVDTALRSVLAAGAEPDIVVVVDPQYYNARHLDRCFPENSFLISDISTHPSVFRHFKPPYILCESHFPFALKAESLMGFTGKLEAGGSVATAAWAAARNLGFTQIFFAGLDLAYPGGQTHYRGSSFEVAVHNQSRRISTPDNQILAMMRDADPFLCPSMNGKSVLTDKRMFVYKNWFEEQMDLNPLVETINLSQTGALIQGMNPGERSSLLKAKARPRLERENLLSMKTKSMTPNHQEILGTLINELREAFSQIRLSAGKGLIAAKAALLLLEKGESLNLNLLEMDRVDQELLLLRGKEIVAFILQPLIYSITWSAEKKPSPEKILQTSLSIYQSIYDSASFHLEILEKKSFFT